MLRFARIMHSTLRSTMYNTISTGKPVSARSAILTSHRVGITCTRPFGQPGRYSNHVTRAAASAAPTATPSDAAKGSSAVVEPTLTWPARSHGCGSVTESLVNQSVTVCGWVDRYRNLGGLLFLDIRDHTGVIQVGLLLLFIVF